MSPRFRSAAAFAAALAATAAPVAEACTRAVYLGPEGQTVTGRTMDWQEDMGTELWLFPRGVARDLGMGEAGHSWTSRYGSVAASIYDGGTADGMNEAGLVANLLFLAESEYPPAEGDDRPVLPISAWTQWALDGFATVAEVVEAMRDAPFRVEVVTAPNGTAGNVHLAVSDPTGDSAIFEFLGGELHVHHGREYQVLTNSPSYDQQIALNAYWRSIGGTVMLPGTNRAADRFARASFYINAAHQSADPREAVAATLSVMRNVSVPRGITTPDQPNISSTLWRTASDQKNRVYYYEDSFSPSLVWVRLDELDFSEGSGVRKVPLASDRDLGGDVADAFRPAGPMTFLLPD